MYLCSLKLVLEATNASTLPVSHGRLLHAAFLNIIRDFSEKLSGKLHDAQIKRFASGVLRTKLRLINNTYTFKPGDIASWHIAVAGQELMAAMSQIKIGKVVRIGRCEFIVDSIICDKEEDSQTGITTMRELRNAVFALPAMRRLTLDFLTPTTFRFYEADFPFPKTEQIFGSLAEKWNSFSEDECFDVELIKELSIRLIPEFWKGESRRVNITKDRGVTGFVGSFTYNLTMLPEEYRFLFVLLSEFGVFTGVGRLNAQGMGQLAVKYSV